jgi:hypothetical protein
MKNVKIFFNAYVIVLTALVLWTMLLLFGDIQINPTLIGIDVALLLATIIFFPKFKRVAKVVRSKFYEAPETLEEVDCPMNLEV